MNLEQAAFVAEVVGAIGVVFSLCFLAFELRRGTERAKRDAVDLLTSNRLEILAQMVADPELFRVVNKCLAGNERVPDHEFARFAMQMYILFVAIELGHWKYLNGDIDEAAWVVWTDLIKWWLKYPGVRSWWRSRPRGLSPRFISHIDDLVDKTPVDNSDAIRIVASYKQPVAAMNMDS